MNELTEIKETNIHDKVIELKKDIFIKGII
jgi:hypothetical protein